MLVVADVGVMVFRRDANGGLPTGCEASSEGSVGEIYPGSLGSNDN